MKKVLASLALAATLAGPAMAADMPVKAAPPPPPPLYDWSGLYVGFNVGAMWYDIDRTFPNPAGAGGFLTGPASNFRTSDSDAIYGFHAGVQGQWGIFVLGIETALSGCFKECESFSGTLPVALGFTPNTSAQHKITNLFTIGPRLGIAWDRWMIYGTGGYASADLKGTYCVVTTGVCGPAVTTQNGNSQNPGWFAGGGFDYMIYQGPFVDVLLGAEYQHWQVDTKRAFCLAVAGCGTLTGADYNLSATGDLVRARLTIKTHGFGFFGPPAPAAVVAKN